MGPSELLSVRIFKQHILEQLPDYFKGIDNQEVDSKIFKTIGLALSYQSIDSAYVLKNEFQQANLDYLQILEEYVEDLASHYVQNPDCKDDIIEQLIKSNNFSFNQKVEAAKELQLAIQRSERKRLKEILRANDEEQEAEELRIVFERLERKALKKRLQEEETPLQYVASEHKTNSMGMWLRVAAILLVILIPAGILFYRNMINETVPTVAETGEKPDSTDDAQYLASEDISGLLDIRLPDVSIKQVFSEIDSDLDRGQGYASEDVTKIKIEVISKASQLKYLKLKTDSIYRKQTDFKNQLKQGNAKMQDPIELRKRIEQLEIARMKCDQLADQIQKSDMLYEFTLTNLKLYSNKDIDPKRFSVREDRNPDTSEMEYFLLLDDKVYKQIYDSKETGLEGRSELNKLNTKVNRNTKNGYVQRIERRSINGNTEQVVTISKNGKNYLLEVKTNTEVTMGEVVFNENRSDWQIVYIKESPYVDKYTSYYMRIIDKGF